MPIKKLQRWFMKMDSRTIREIALVTLAFIGGFAYGNYFRVGYEFKFQEWQTSVSAVIAILFGVVGFFGVKKTLTVNVMIKEQDRIDATLPGLRQAHDLLISVQRQLKELRTLQHLWYLVSSKFGIQDKESVEEAVRRSLPLELMNICVKRWSGMYLP
jgi:hypothetical protein